MALIRVLSKAALSGGAGAVGLVSRTVSPEVVDRVLGGSAARGALEHVCAGSSTVILAGAATEVVASVIQMKERTARILSNLASASVGLYYLYFQYGDWEPAQAAFWNRPIQTEQLLADAIGVGLGIAGVVLANRAYPDSSVEEEER